MISRYSLNFKQHLIIEGRMKPTTVLYLLLLLGLITWILNSTHLLDSAKEGFEDLLSSPISEPIVPKGLIAAKGDTEAMPNPAIPNQLPFGPYAQMASVGSFQYQDPAMMPAQLAQMKKINEDLRAFLAFEGVQIANSSDPTVSLPLTQLRADARKLQDEVSVLDKNPGVQSQLTQQSLAEIEGALMFLQKKVRLFESAGVVSGTDGFKNPSKPIGGDKDSHGCLISGGYTWCATLNKCVRKWETPCPPPKKSTDKYNIARSPKDAVKIVGKAVAAADKRSEKVKEGEKTKATKKDLELLQTKTYAAILTLSASGTVDPVVQARIKRLQEMYTALSDMITKLNKGQWTQKDIPVFKEDIQEVLPNLAKPQKDVKDVFSQGNGKKLNAIEEQLSGLVGVENAQDVFKNLKERGMFRISMDLGYNVTGDTNKKSSTYKRNLDLQGDGSMKASVGMHPHVSAQSGNSMGNGNGLQMESAYDSHSPGFDENAIRRSDQPKASHFDWKKRATTICEQVKLRGLDPLDFGCIAKDSLMSPAYSWRGHAKMVCGRLGTTMDPDLPVVCGCPPQKWKGWSSPS
jgi:hypothetical protein